MQGLCAEKNTIGLRKRLIAALYSRSPTKNSRIVIRRAKAAGDLAAFLLEDTP